MSKKSKRKKRIENLDEWENIIIKSFGKTSYCRPLPAGAGAVPCVCRPGMAWPGDNEIQVYRESCSTWTSQSQRTQHHCHSSHRGQQARRTRWEPSLDLTSDFGCNSLRVVLWLLRKSPSPAIIFQTFDGTTNRCELRQSHYDCQVFTFSRLYRNKGTINIIGDEKKI